MSLKAYIVGMAVATIFSWIAWVLVLVYIGPYDSSILGLAAFFLTLLFGLTGIFTIFGFYFRVWANKNEVVYAQVGVSFRQGFLLAVALVGLLLLQTLGVFNLWSAALYIGAIILIEFYALSR